MNAASPSRLQDFECLFAQMQERLECLPPPRSVAELELSRKEIEEIRQCFKNLITDPRLWLTDSKPRRIKDDLCASPSDVIAGLLLILGAEVCRSEGTEGAVWPYVRECLPPAFETEAFPGGQPSADLKDALDRVTRKLKLRSAIGWEDSLEYFNTLKLQFAFTRRGARRRLAEWLVGLGETAVIRALRGADSVHSAAAAPGFRSLWCVLKRYRAENLGEDEARRFLEDSPWVRGDWIDELLKQARARREQLGVGESAETGSQTEKRDGVHFPVRLTLDWSGRDPCFSLELDEDEVESIVAGWKAQRLRIAIDGADSLIWLRQSGAWRGKRQIRLPNWNAATMTISSMDGGNCVDFELGETGLNDDLLVFDINDGGLLHAQARMKTTRSYALLCDDILELAGADCIDSYDKARKFGRRLYRLPVDWPKTLRLELGGLVYWKPRMSEAAVVEQLDLVVSNSSPASLGEKRPLVIDGVPNDASEISLLFGKKAKETPTARFGSTWRTEGEIPLDVPLLTGENRLRVRVRTAQNNRCWPAKTQWSVTGLAVLERDKQGGRSSGPSQWKICDRDASLDRVGGRLRARVFTPSDGEGPRICEGFRSAAQGQRPFDLSRFLARGDALKTQGGLVLAKSVEDRGCVVRFYPRILGRDYCSVLLNDQVEPSDEHKIVLWHADADRPIQNVNVERLRNKNARCSEWVLSPYEEPLAWAIVFRGERIGSHWRPEKLAQWIPRHPTTETFALLRWFKVPVLGPEISSAFFRAIKENPVDFVRGWVGNGGLPCGLKHTETTEELDTVVRSALWQTELSYPMHADQILRLFVDRIRVQNEDRPDETLHVLAARRMAGLCPPFAWRVLRKVKKGKKLARSAVRELPAVADDSSHDKRNAALQSLRCDSRRRLTCDSARLDELTKAFLKYMKKRRCVEYGKRFSSTAVS